MDDSDNNLTFDFKEVVDGANAVMAASCSRAASSYASGPSTDGSSHGRGRGSIRQIVCGHWLCGLCTKGDECGFLHQYAKDHMPVCHFFSENNYCREEECIFKYTDPDVKQCEM